MNAPSPSQHTVTRVAGLSMDGLRDWGWLLAFGAPLALWPFYRAPIAAIGGEPPLYATFAGMVLLMTAAIVTVSDLAYHRIPNWVTYPAILWGLAINIYASTAAGAPRSAELGAVGWQESLLGLIALFIVMLVIFSLTGGGAGDVKLSGAIGALLGFERGADALLVAMVAAGATLAVWLLVRKGPRAVFDVTLRPLASRFLPLWVNAPTDEQRKLMTAPAPLGPFFAFGIVMALAGARLDWATF